MKMDQNAEMKKQEMEQILELGSDITKSQKGNVYTLTIIGQIEGHQVLPESVKTTKYEHILPLLAGIEESDEIDGLLLLLNTVGGDIEAGLAISEMIGGIPSVTIACVSLTGIMGLLLTPYIIRFLRMKDPVATGVALGTSCHALGTVRAMEMGQEQGAMSSLAMCISGVVMVIIGMLL